MTSTYYTVPLQLLTRHWLLVEVLTRTPMGILYHTVLVQMNSDGAFSPTLLQGTSKPQTIDQPVCVCESSWDLTLPAADWTSHILNSQTTQGA